MQDRDERIQMLSSALVEGWRAGTRVNLDFSGSRAFGAGGCAFGLDDLPDGRIGVVACVELLRINRSWVLEDTLDPEGLRRDKALRETGWPSGNFPTRSWELDPVDRDAVGHIVDDLKSAFDASAVPAEIDWRIRVGSKTQQGISRVPRAEPWITDALDRDLSGLVRRLAGLRGGWLSVRYSSGSSTVIRVTAHRRRGSIIMEATNLGPRTARARDPRARWTEQWSLHEWSLDVRDTFRALEAALARFSPPGSGGSVSLRFELGDEASYWPKVFDGTTMLTLLGFLTISGIIVLLGDPTSEGLLGAVGRAKEASASISDTLVLLAAVATPLLVSEKASRLSKDVADARRWRYSFGRHVMAITWLAACLAIVVALLIAGKAWWAVAAVPWLVWLGGRSLQRIRGAS
ncbi:MAG TPA: hypothetical protein VFX65_04410 [Candidatus Limnocylindrales bacterium]|nr:hypothetical protein [Candidatus Limnocylindrales bacterium]